MQVKLTVPVIKGLQPGEEVRDTDVKGFGARRRQAEISFFVHTRVNGRLARITIGKAGAWTVEKARDRAKEILRNIATGRNPMAEKAVARDRSIAFSKFAEDFKEQYCCTLKASTRATYGHVIKNQLVPVMGSVGVGDIARVHVDKLRTRFADKPRSANHAMSILSVMMKWAEARGLRDKNTNPCDGVSRYPETERHRYLRIEELQRLGAVLRQREESGQVGIYTLGAIMLLILSGARKNEILKLKWKEVDFSRSALFLDDSKTGKKTIPLNTEAIRVLKAMPRISGNPYVFVGAVNGKHLTDISKAWEAIRKDAGLEDLRLHDLRHSFASWAVGVGGSLPIIGKILGHRQQDTTARYTHVGDALAGELSERTGALAISALKGNVLQNSDAPSPRRGRKKAQRLISGG